jgi:antibiotic biosynthesis monooxygenase (ABM) superfamily enzyme
MELTRPIFRVLAIVTACLLVSCIDGREEIWLNANGSGRADVSYTLPAAAARFQGGEAGIRRLIGDFIKATPGISSSSFEVTTTAERLKIHVLATFDSVLDFKAIAKDPALEKLPSSASHLAGEMTVNVQGRTIGFSRTVSPGKALPGAILLPVSQFTGRKLTYIIHLPEAATESNATRVENAGRTLVWDYPLAEAIQAPPILRFKANYPLPTRAIASVAAVVLLLAYFVIRWKIGARNSFRAGAPTAD